MVSAQASLARTCVRRNRASVPNSNIQWKTDKTSPFAYMKHGIGRLTATMDDRIGQSKLTEISHKSPMRWLPLQSSRVQKAGAAIAAMSNYGAGLLPGDVNQVQVKVQPKARLAVLTQGSNRIYKQGSRFSKPASDAIQTPAVSTLQARVEDEGFLVVAPDPTVPFAQSSFHQQQEFSVYPTSSLIAIDWISSGRFANGERWRASKITSETKLKLIDHDEDTSIQLVWDATTLDQRSGINHNYSPFGFDLGQNSFNAYASMLLYGSESLPVVEQLQDLQHQLAAPHTRLRPSTCSSPLIDLTATGRVLLGVNPVQVAEPAGPVYLARWAASSNEDLYRMFHHALKPLTPRFGLEFFQDRIRATSSIIRNTTYFPSAPIPTPEKTATTALPIQIPTATTTLPTPKSSAAWGAYMLTDSALPTGSFAHSAGLEAASQLGLLRDGSSSQALDATLTDDNGAKSNEATKENVQLFVRASTRSTLQQVTPWILSGHRIGSQLLEGDSSLEEALEAWKRLDRHSHAAIAASAMACGASIDQGRNLLRVALPWIEEGHIREERALALLQAIQEHIKTSRSSTSGHMGPLFGILGRVLQLEAEEACQLLGYCVARDIVSAAVRLNLIGPLKSVAMLSKMQESAQEGIRIGLLHAENAAVDPIIDEHYKDSLLWTDVVAGGSAPVLDAVHPCHDMLSVRLFRT